MNKKVQTLAASGLALSLTVIGCTPAAQLRPASLSSTAPKVEKDSAKLYAEAQAAVQAGKTAEALALAERTVESAPRDVGYRMLLGDLYLKSGRFASAEAAFSDVVTLDPGNVRGTLSLALAMIAQGKNLMASAELDKLDGTASPGDLGLAFALAGEHGRAIPMLEEAARGANATGRVRQNLALAYAFAGDWQKARVTAAQDVSPADLNIRIEQWAALAKPQHSYSQVAALLGVTPAEDPGQPARLALAPSEPEPVAFAEAASVSEPVVEAIPVVAAAAPVVAIPRAPAAPVLSPPAAPIVPAPAAPVTLPVQYAAAAQELVTPSPVLIKPIPAVATIPVPTFKAAKARLDSRPRGSADGRFVVQIGAYRNLGQASRAWADAEKRYAVAGSKRPLSTTVNLPGRGTFYRLSLAPFEDAGQAARACQSIRAKGGNCFVRSVAGDAPLQYALRNQRRG
jgi:Flp pilus assembly protein TadD